MDNQQAEAVARAILEPDQRSRDEFARKRALEQASLAKRRRVAWFTLGGCTVGAAVAYFSGSRVGGGALFGGLAGTLVGWVVVILHARRHAA